MVRGEDLSGLDDEVALDLAVSPEVALSCPPSITTSGRGASGPRLDAPHDRTAAIAKLDETLGVIDEILELLRQRSPRGSQSRIFVEAAAIAATRARELTQGLIEDPSAPEAIEGKAQPGFS